MTDWGAHMFDVAQWALGKDRNGPVEIIPPGHSYYDHLTYLYDNGVVMTEEPFDGTKQGVKFYGDNGWIQVCRGEVLASDPVFLPDTRTKTTICLTRRGSRTRSTLSNLCARASTRRCRSKSDTAHARSATSVTSHTNWGAPSNGTPSSRNSWTTRTQPHCCITPTATAIRWKADIRTAAADSRHSSRDTLPPGVFRSPTRKNRYYANRRHLTSASCLFLHSSIT